MSLLSHLREAARQQAPWNHFVTNACKCTTGCLNCKFIVYETILAAAPTATSLHHVPTVQGICFCLNQSNCTTSRMTGNNIEVTETPCHIDFNAWSKCCDDVDGKCTSCIKCM